MKINKQEWREMMGLAEADERGARGLNINTQTKNNDGLREDIEKAIKHLQRCLETLDDNP